MYPTLYDFFYDAFGIQIGGLRFVNTFGFFVAMAFFVAFRVAKKELKRRQDRGVFSVIEVKKVVGHKASFLDLFFYFAFGFAFGYKFGGIFSIDIEVQNSQAYIFSWQGSWIVGILVGALFCYVNYKAKKKEELPKPIEKTVQLTVPDLMDNVLIICLVAGMLGAKIFHNLENLDSFLEDPIRSLFSFSGLTFYGGLICSIVALWIYARKYKINFLHFTDALCIGTLFAYGVGRFGCHFSGDGDWGIFNTSPNPLPFLPNWWWAYDYPHNVLGVQLEATVFPTPLYEAVVCLLLGFFLQFLSRRIRVAGMIMGIYLLMIGVERFLVELIRVNTKYHIGSFSFTQAELISFCCLVGGAWLIYFSKKHQQQKATL